MDTRYILTVIVMRCCAGEKEKRIEGKLHPTMSHLMPIKRFDFEIERERYINSSLDTCIRVGAREIGP